MSFSIPLIAIAFVLVVLLTYISRLSLSILDKTSSMKLLKSYPYILLRKIATALASVFFCKSWPFLNIALWNSEHILGNLRIDTKTWIYSCICFIEV